MIKITYATSCRLHIGNYKTLCLRTGASLYFLSHADLGFITNPKNGEVKALSVRVP